MTEVMLCLSLVILAVGGLIDTYAISKLRKKLDEQSKDIDVLWLMVAEKEAPPSEKN